MSKPIIIAEDNETARQTFVRYIERSSGREVHQVGDGKDLVERVKSEDYCLVFTDNDMPFMTGLIAIKEIRKFNPSVPICMMSGDKAEELKPRAMEAGATDYIDKGDYKEFVANLESVVGKYTR